MTESPSTEKAAERPIAEHAGTHAPDSAAVPAAAVVVVDRVSHEDIPEICALYKRVWETPKSDLPAEFLKAAIPTALEFTSRMEGVTYFAAREGKKLLGIVGCAFAGGSCRLVDLAVDVEARRKGVGTALVTAAVDWARKSHANAVWVDSLARFPTAVQLFQRLGFTEAGILHRHSWNEDVRFLEKIL